MGIIQKLSPILVNQISAGEVVERPVSVVKELVENSIDSGATNIKIEILGGGTIEIIISDNGNGIDRQDLEIITEKHTTSKIKNLDDLYNIMTFGFRGEALASISSVSDFKIITKTENCLVGYSLELIGGAKLDIKEESFDLGTKIIVKNLFYNTPARLNYLKKERTEYSHIYEFLNQISLSYPSLGFEFLSEGKVVFKYNAGEDLRTRIYNIYGNDFYDNLLSIDFSFAGLNIKGYISSPKVSFQTKNKQSIFVNNRVISSPLIYKAISESYNRFIPHGTYPSYVLNLQINPEEIDVNVHPRKQEIRFAREQEIYKAFYSAVNKRLENDTLVGSKTENINELLYQSIANTEENIKTTQTSNYNVGNTKPSYYTGSGTKFKSYSPYKDITSNPNQFQIRDSIEFTKTLLDSDFSENFEKSTDLHDTPLGKIIGQSFNSYIIVENKTGILVLDQHALAERVIYEKLVNNDKKTITSQGLLVQEAITLSPKETNILEQYKDLFYTMGFDFEVLSSGIVMLSSVPDFIKKENISDIFSGVIEDISDFNSNKSLSLDEVKNKIFAYTACRSAIKFGNKLNLFEMNKLLNDSILIYSSTCPHGRPVIFELGLEELKKKYER